MGKYSNIVLAENGVILGALKPTSLQDDFHRILLSGAKYAYPAPQDKIAISDGAGMRRMAENFFETHKEAWDKETLATYIFERVSGLALPTAREIATRFIAQNEPLDMFIVRFCEDEPSNPYLAVQNGAYTDFFAFPIEGGEPVSALHIAEDKFYHAKESKKSFADKKRRLEASVRALKKKAGKRLQETVERIAEAEKAEENRIKGELLTANLYRIQKGEKSVQLENWYDPDCATIKIALDPLLSPAQNAQRFFKIYAKQKRALEILVPMREKEEAELAYADSVLASIYSAEEAEDFKEIEVELIEAGLLRAPKARVGAKKKDMPVPFREFEKDGFTVLVGRNNIQNDRLVRTASADDIWLHTQKYHSAHAVIVTEGKKVPDEVIGFAAQICAYYSDGRDGGKIPVDYCKRKFVKKPNKSRAGFVTYTDYKTVLVEGKLPR
jgi:predicted ribosome quality control (RQC) complex YloA/Tae2 family protein